MKNSLRQLASTITTACHKQGTKQSVILELLVKNKGFRSFQASDDFANKAPTIHCDVIYDLRQKLLHGFPDSDLYVDIDINDKLACLNHKLPNKCIISSLWHEATNGYVALLTLAANIEAGLQLLEIMMVDYTKVLSVDSAIEMIPVDLPDVIKSFFANEFKEGTEGHDIVHSRLIDLIERLNYEISSTADHLRSAATLKVTTSKPSRVVTVLVTAIDSKLQTEEDKLLNVEGGYRIELASSVPFAHLANAALDTFHSQISFERQENYSIIIVDKNGDDIEICSDVTSYSYNNHGCII